LPKPKKVLLDKRVEYYLEATGKRLESSQTATYRPLVVKNEGECKKKVVAPFVPNARCRCSRRCRRRSPPEAACPGPRWRRSWGRELREARESWWRRRTAADRPPPRWLR